MPRTILCYGDSNTWGYVPGKADVKTGYVERYARNERWPGLLQTALGDDFHVVEEGLNGRTTNLDHAIPPDRNGSTYLPPCLYSHAPLDLIILALGGNDLKTYYNRSPESISGGLSTLIGIIQQSTYGPDMQQAPEVLIITQPIPLAISETIVDENGVAFFDEGISKAKTLVGLYADLASSTGCYFLDITERAIPSVVDGVHFDSKGHQQMAMAVEEKIREIFKE